jgi:hypothetical protein
MQTYRKEQRMGRKKLPIEQVAKTIAIRLTPANIVMFKQLGSAKWLSKILEMERANNKTV